MNKYYYSGPVYEFERLLTDRWTATTQASSEKKARSNLAYQFKIQYDRVPRSRITVPGKLTIIKGDDDNG